MKKVCLLRMSGLSLSQDQQETQWDFELVPIPMSVHLMIGLDESRSEFALTILCTSRISECGHSLITTIAQERNRRESRKQGPAGFEFTVSLRWEIHCLSIKIGKSENGREKVVFPRRRRRSWLERREKGGVVLLQWAKKPRNRSEEDWAVGGRYLCSYIKSKNEI